MMLADMGADVIKVEKIPGGDDCRRFAPILEGGESASFMIVNRNKRGVAINLKTDGGREVLRKMLATADVVTENYRRGTMEKLGMGYEALKAENPGLIYCAISGFGRSGPMADKGGFDLIAQGMSGLMSMTGEPGSGADQGGLASHRYQRGHSRRAWNLRGVLGQAKDRAGPDGRYLAIRSGFAADVLGLRQLLRRRHGVAQGRLGESDQRAVSGVPDA